METTSTLVIRTFVGNFDFSNLRNMSAVSRKCVGCTVTIGRIKKSTNSYILVVGLEHPLMMGRPTNEVPWGGVLCIFRRKHTVGKSHCWESGSR